MVAQNQLDTYCHEGVQKFDDDQPNEETEMAVEAHDPRSAVHEQRT